MSHRESPEYAPDAVAGFCLGLLAGCVGVVSAQTAGTPGDFRLVDAARSRDLQTVRSLLSRHADVDARAHDGATALLWAAHWNDLDIADLLIRAGANANAANDLRVTPLSQACTNGSAALVGVNAGVDQSCLCHEQEGRWS